MNRFQRRNSLLRHFIIYFKYCFLCMCEFDVFVSMDVQHSLHVEVRKITSRGWFSPPP